MKKSKLIFYLDDDADDLYIFKTAVEALGQRIGTFADGHELLQTLRHTIEKPDIIFLDIHMPILNGEEILNILKNSDDYKHIPIVMISGAYPKKLVRQFLDSGANYLMKKQFGPALKDILNEIIHIDWNHYKVSA